MICLSTGSGDSPGDDDTKDHLAAWTFPGSLDVAGMVEIARDGLRPPDLRLQVLSSVGDTAFVQVVDGVARPQADILYVERRGAYAIARREEWLGGRMFLTLTAWPRR
jgi:hypothetical protein